MRFGSFVVEDIRPQTSKHYWSSGSRFLIKTCRPSENSPRVLETQPPFYTPVLCGYWAIRPTDTAEFYWTTITDDNPSCITIAIEKKI